MAVVNRFMQLALVLSGVFCLIHASAFKEVCQVDAAMSLYNENIQIAINWLFRGSKMYKVHIDTDGTIYKPRVYNIHDLWINWSGKKVTRTMFLYEKDNSAAIIGDSESTHLFRLNEKFEVVANSYKSWSGDFLQDFAVDGVSPTQGIFVSNYQPGYVCPFQIALNKTSCELMSIDLTKSEGAFKKGGGRHKRNPDLWWWLNNFQNENLKLIGIFKTGSNFYCKGTTCQTGEIAWDYEESFVAFIENDHKTWHCAGKFSDKNREDCTRFSQYQRTNKTLFGCDEKGDGLTFTSSTIRTLTFESKAQTKTIGFDNKNKPNWTMWALFGTLIIVILAASYFGFSLRNKQDAHKYQLLNEKNKRTKIETSKFKPRKAKDLKLFGSSESETEKHV